MFWKNRTPLHLFTRHGGVCKAKAASYEYEKCYLIVPPPEVTCTAIKDRSQSPSMSLSNTCRPVLNQALSPIYSLDTLPYGGWLDLEWERSVPCDVSVEDLRRHTVSLVCS